MSISHPCDIIRVVEEERKFLEKIEPLEYQKTKINEQLIDMFNFPFDPNMYKRLMERIQEIDREIESHRPILY
jgi:uncharacterized protein (UPF0276 family)